MVLLQFYEVYFPATRQQKEPGRGRYCGCLISGQGESRRDPQEKCSTCSRSTLSSSAMPSLR